MNIPYIWHLTSGKPGPKVIVLGGTHGDERPGIEVIRTLLSRLGLAMKPAGSYEITGVRGDLYIGFGNPEAIVRCTRGTTPSTDLNRSFVEDKLAADPAPSDTEDLRRARVLAPLFRKCEVLLDLHATHTPSPPFAYCDRLTDKHRRIISQIPGTHVLTDAFNCFNPEEGPSRTADAYMDRHGVNGVGVCYEIGQQDDVSRAHEALKAVLRILSVLGSVNFNFGGFRKSIERLEIKTNQRVFALVEEMFSERKRVTYCPGLDRLFAKVKKGGLIGTYRGGFPVHAPRDGHLVFQHPGWTIKPGQSLLYIAEEI